MRSIGSNGAKLSQFVAKINEGKVERRIGCAGTIDVDVEMAFLKRRFKKKQQNIPGQAR